MCNMHLLPCLTHRLAHARACTSSCLLVGLHVPMVARPSLSRVLCRFRNNPLMALYAQPWKAQAFMLTCNPEPDPADT